MVIDIYALNTFVQGNFCLEVKQLKDISYMQLALQLAKKGLGWVSPNPMVGAVIVKDGRIIGQGYHEQYGEPHAERNALASCVEKTKGATMYVTLEPCCHHGKQPPCVDAILEAGIRRVVVGATDPNPLVSGKGIHILREHGVDVVAGVLQEESRKMNEVFWHYIQTGRPFVTMKYAMTLDGKIAAYTGLSQWITGERAREHVHQQRHAHRAIMVGVGTVLADDPMLTCRMERGRNPIRIICDTSLRTPLYSRIVTTANRIPTMIATCCKDIDKWKAYQKAGCKIISVGEDKGHVDLKELMSKLGQEKIDSILLEGGGSLNWSAMEAGIVQKVQAYIAPKLLGGATAKSPIDGLGFAEPNQGIQLENSKILRLGEDFLIEGKVKENVYRNY